MTDRGALPVTGRQQARQVADSRPYGAASGEV